MQIGWSLLIQLCITELLSLIFFLRVGGGVLLGIIAPVCGIAFPISDLYDPPALLSAFTIETTLIAAGLLAATLLAWLRFRRRILAHVALALYCFYSIYVLCGFAI
jgi:hypothetical protein